MGGLVSKLLSLDELFKGRHFDAEIIVLAEMGLYAQSCHEGPVHSLHRIASLSSLALSAVAPTGY